MTDLRVSSTENQNMFADAEVARRIEPGADDRAEGGTAHDSALEQERALFPSHQCAGLRDEWQSIQADFVDSPRASVEKADALVRKTIDTLANSFADMRNSLDQTWERTRKSRPKSCAWHSRITGRSFAGYCRSEPGLKQHFFESCRTWREPISEAKHLYGRARRFPVLPA